MSLDNSGLSAVNILQLIRLRFHRQVAAPGSQPESCCLRQIYTHSSLVGQGGCCSSQIITNCIDVQNKQDKKVVDYTPHVHMLCKDTVGPDHTTATQHFNWTGDSSRESHLSRHCFSFPMLSDSVGTAEWMIASFPVPLHCISQDERAFLLTNLLSPLPLRLKYFLLTHWRECFTQTSMSLPLRCLWSSSVAFPSYWYTNTSLLSSRVSFPPVSTQPVISPLFYLVFWLWQMDENDILISIMAYGG